MKFILFTRTALCRSSAWVIVLFLTLLAACTSVSVDREVGAMEQLPPPDRVLVYNFAVTPQEVQLDAVGSTITSTLDGTADSQQEVQIGHAVADALAKRLVSDIQNMGLNAERASGPMPPAGTDVLIFGQLVQSTRATRRSESSSASAPAGVMSKRVSRFTRARPAEEFPSKPCKVPLRAA